MDEPNIAARIREKSGNARRLGLVLLAASVVIGGAIIYFFSSVNLGWAGIGASAADPLAAAILLGLVPLVSRIAAIVMAVFVIKIMVDITRYHFRIAEHLDAFAFALEIAPTDADKLVKAAAAISVSHIQFGQMPDSISEKVLKLGRAFSKSEK